MGYSKGRKFTDEELIVEARKYKTKRELKALDNSLLQIAKRRGIPSSKLFEHTVDVKFSVPQMMCKLIMETILNKKCLYNTRQIIKPYEIDIYFPQYKLGVEYSGDYWHSKQEAIERDKIKQKLCKDQSITLIVLNMKSRKWEEDVKQQLIKELPNINKITNNNILPEEILSIDCKKIYKNVSVILDLEEIEQKIATCNSIEEFGFNFKREYHYLQKSKQTHLLDKLRKKNSYPDTLQELNELCKEIHNYGDFIKNHTGLYNKCIRLGIIKEVTKHMKKARNLYEIYTNEELLLLVPKDIKNTNQLKKTNTGLYNELLKRNILNQCHIPPSQNRKQHFAKNVEYFNKKIVPLIEQGMSVNDISVQQLLPISYVFLWDLIRLFGSLEIKSKAHANKIKNYKNRKKSNV